MEPRSYGVNLLELRVSWFLIAPAWRQIFAAIQQRKTRICSHTKYAREKCYYYTIL